MKNSIGNGIICVEGYANKITINLSRDGGSNWIEVKCRKGIYGSKEKVRKVFNYYIRTDYTYEDYKSMSFDDLKDIVL